MDKQQFLSFINKYYLNGFVERVKWSVKDNMVTTNFVSTNKDMSGTIESFVELSDCNIAIYDTSQLYKLTNVLNQYIKLDLHTPNNIPTKLLLADTEFDLQYVLADSNLIPKSPNINEPEYSCNFSIDKELINKYIKAHKAIGSSIVKFETLIDKHNNSIINVVVGEDSEHSNKVIFTIPLKQFNKGFKLKFNADYIKEIFDNNKDVEENKGFGYVSEQGLLKFEFENISINQKSKYFIVANN